MTRRIVAEYEDGYIVETDADGDKILEMFDEKHELRIRLQCEAGDYLQALEKAVVIAGLMANDH